MKIKMKVDSVEKWYRLLNNGFCIKNQHYNVQPWIIKPKQCCYCASLIIRRNFVTKLKDAYNAQKRIIKANIAKQQKQNLNA